MYSTFFRIKHIEILIQTKIKNNAHHSPQRQRLTGKDVYRENTLREGLSLQTNILESVFIIKTTITYLRRFLLNVLRPFVLTNSPQLTCFSRRFSRM